ncbi:sugar phosphate isomerase/epimerase [Nesterenkonia massiliensis]|uniref:Sugar phosphate isomerase/epimerase n=1 Tax=Nesterenkonia massiliensis TaxID=1232429 RepID=A0ABT2HR57_9MICC|nr:sugar phosphate isomerase/epimerase family protein [Nesterenkonia massiliensis]MCT1607168.1 sugar phosphate isomerase/epimerase [Nesterenkonia massiliensis]
MSWQFAFSTLGIPQAPAAEVLELAQRYSCDGVEVRVHPEEFLHLNLTSQQTQAVSRMFGEANLHISALAGYARICSPSPDTEVIDELMRLIDLAHAVGQPGLSTPGVRVFPGGDDESSSEEHLDRAVRRVEAVLPHAREAGVQVLVETHDSHPTAAAAQSLVAPLQDTTHAAVLWDGLHPWRSGESTEESMTQLRGQCSYFQVKDAVYEADRWVPVALGQGKVPLTEQGQSLQQFSGWISLEWERAWHPQIPPLERVLPAAVEWFRTWQPNPAN